MTPITPSRKNPPVQVVSCHIDMTEDFGSLESIKTRFNAKQVRDAQGEHTIEAHHVNASTTLTSKPGPIQGVLCLSKLHLS